MELGSGSSSSSSSSSSDSLNGLKFGKKIYFEDATAGGLAKPTGAAGLTTNPAGRPPPAPPMAKKGRSGVVPSGQPPRCQVEGCKIDLSDAKAYYSRHKVCGMHSKSPKVIVAGLEQRFCQQCSRFHLLPEFDQGKRSCRRRLAGHNERRRKPPPGTMLSSRYGSLSSPYFENNGRGGSFLMDFSMYPTLTGRDSWPNTRSTDQRLFGNQQQSLAGKFYTHALHSNPDTVEFLLQGSSGSRTTTTTTTATSTTTTNATYLDSSIPSGECFAGVSDSSRALSLLSTQPWGSRNLRSSSRLGVNGFINTSEGTSPLSGEAINHFSPSSSLWGGFKCDESSSNSHELPPDLGLGQFSPPDRSNYALDLGVAHQQNGREYLGLDHTRAYDSASSSVQNMHWSL